MELNADYERMLVMAFWCGGQLLESSSDQVPWWDYGVGRPGWDNETEEDDNE